MLYCCLLFVIVVEMVNKILWSCHSDDISLLAALKVPARATQWRFVINKHNMSIIFSRNISLFWDKYVTGAGSVITFYLRPYFPSSYSWNKAKLGVSSTRWPLNRGDNKESTLIGMVKRWPWSLMRDLISCSFLQLLYFRTLITGRLIEGGCLMAVQLYFFYKEYDFLKWNKLWNSPEFWCWPQLNVNRLHLKD